MRSFLAGLAVLAVAAAGANAEFEDFSTAQLENMLRDLEYQEDYKAPVDTYDYNPMDVVPGDYYDQYDQGSDGSEQDESMIMDLMQKQHRDIESLAHGPAVAAKPAAAGAPASGTTKANVPKNSGAVLPAYCDPPNPCPLGYSDKDGCIEDFENTSEFSRNYQSQQNCLCDSEHMFNCPVEEPSSKMQDPAFLAGFPPSLESHLEQETNPFLAGHKLPTAAKKGLGF